MLNQSMKMNLRNTISQINLTQAQAQQIEHYRNRLKTVKINWIVTGFLLGAFCGWGVAWLW